MDAESAEVAFISVEMGDRVDLGEDLMHEAINSRELFLIH